MCKTPGSIKNAHAKPAPLTSLTGEICIVLEGADGAPQSPIQGPPGGSAEQGGPTDGGAASTSVGTVPGVPPELERARPMLTHLIASGECTLGVGELA